MMLQVWHFHVQLVHFPRLYSPHPQSADQCNQVLIGAGMNLRADFPGAVYASLRSHPRVMSRLISSGETAICERKSCLWPVP